MTIDLPSLGWDDAFAADFDRLTVRDPCGIGALEPGRVSHAGRGVCTVLGAGGPRRVSLSGGLLGHAAGDPRRLPCPGDWVAVRTWPDGRLTIDAILPRRGVIEAGSDVVVANLDLVAVVEPLRPAPDLARVGRLLELARGCGASPIIVLTGADAVVDPGRRRARVATRFPDVPIITTKPVIVYGQTLALVGTVGAGTAHLVQSLVGAAVMRRRGRHREPRGLILLPDGGAVFDASDDWLEGTGGQSLERARKIVIPRG